MLFNSFAYAFFLPTVFAAYWLLRARVAAQNALVVLASYVFYGWWDWRFLLLVWVSTLTDFYVGIGLDGARRPGTRRTLVGVSLGVNLGLLGTFKYFDFFASSFAAMAARLGHVADPVTLNLVLPLGISFYTFQTLAYTIDVYRGHFPATRDLTAFAAYVSFFPQLVAGPIERASRLLPQFLRARSFDAAAAVDGMRQILWGLFKKVVVADTCGLLVDDIFAGYPQYSALTLALGCMLFAVQVYGDFSGYSDIAIGTGRLFGFNLVRNFAYPLFARDMAELWRRWHISLTTWLRDYVFVPLGGARVSRPRLVGNLLIVFMVGGLWHGAAWTFVLWGLLNGLLILAPFLGGSRRHRGGTVARGRMWPTPREALLMARTFVVFSLGAVLFRAESLTHAAGYVSAMASASLVYPLHFSTRALAAVGSMLLVEWFQREREHGLQAEHWPPWLRRTVYVVLCLAIAKSWGVPRDFVYFQF